MPKIFEVNDFRFFFYSNEGSPLEPVHVHVAKRGTGEAKVRLYPFVGIDYSRGFSAQDQRWIASIVQARFADIVSAWNEHFDTGD